MGINSQEVAYSFGQLGSAFLNDTATFLPPTGSVVVAIHVLSSLTTFTVLTPDTSGYIDGTTGAAGTGAVAYFGTTNVVGANGTLAEEVPTSYKFNAGTMLYGRWTGVTLGAGEVIMYFGPAV